MKLTNHVTTLRFSQRRKATGGRRDMEMFFQGHEGQPVRFKDETGRPQEGILVDLLDEGVFIVKTKDGQEHDVGPNQILLSERDRGR